MSLSKATSISIAPATTTDLVTFTGNGVKALLGFNAEGSTPALYELTINGAYEASVRTTAENLTAQFYDRLQIIANGVVVKVTVSHTAGTAANFSGTILGS